MNTFSNELPIIQRTGLWASVFMLGSLVRELELEQVASKVRQRWLGGLTLVYFLYLVLWYLIDFETRISYYLPRFWGVIFYVSVFMAVLAFQLLPYNRVYAYFQDKGKNSLVIYILHAPIVSVTRIVLLKLGIDSVFLHLLLGSLAGWFGSLLALVILSKVPYIDAVFYPYNYLKKPSSN